MRRLFVVFLVLGLTLAFITVAGTTSAIADDDDDDERKVFTLKDLRGNFGFSFQGTISVPDLGPLPVAATGLLKVDGKGNVFKASRTLVIFGLDVLRQTFTCKISLEHDGTGSAICPIDDPGDFPPVETFDFVVDDDVNEYRFVGTTDPFTIVVLGTGRRQ